MLPLLGSLEAPSPFGSSFVGTESWSRFQRCQWMFITLQLENKNGVRINRGHSRSIEQYQIMPITIEEVLFERCGRGARVRKAKPHAASGLSEEVSLIALPLCLLFPLLPPKNQTRNLICCSLTIEIDRYERL
ncbi:hypothetical protein F5Y16DRAFT_389771 [Xylariaceae sp. FL0255]|nr:hypothetical protein F5Y16DRAFT_389771 [Xylariaceae sp. FL0255]